MSVLLIIKTSMYFSLPRFSLITKLISIYKHALSPADFIDSHCHSINISFPIPSLSSKSSVLFLLLRLQFFSASLTMNKKKQTKKLHTKSIKNHVNHTHENLIPSSFEKQLAQWSLEFLTRTSVP